MNQLVILSEAKDLLAGIERRKMILRFAQDDKFCGSLAGAIRGERHKRSYNVTKDK